MTEIISFILRLAEMRDAAAAVRKAVCEEMGLSEEEVEIRIHPDGNIHVIATPAEKVDDITITLAFDGEKGAPE